MTKAWQAGLTRRRALGAALEQHRASTRPREVYPFAVCEGETSTWLLGPVFEALASVIGMDPALLGA